MIPGLSPTEYNHPPFSNEQAQAVTTVPEQLCHLVLDQATEAMIAAEGSHRSGHVPVFRVQRAKPEPRHPEVLRREAPWAVEEAASTHLSALPPP